MQHWAVDRDAEAALLDDGLPGAAGIGEPIEAFVDPAGSRRRRRRSYAAADEHSPKKTKLWRVAMWGLILVLLVGWLMMIAVLTSRSGADSSKDRRFEFDRGNTVEPGMLTPE